ncbi:hypothetical protein J2S19_003469 [Metabacillus malikii]|uniref:Uncharacterized protein n=2 Tax=Metabacillus malikii TaxID=1504265 RepID=A0ABT9ZIT2_9BACI|nr:hypothetical protein [Metabacillus malikii]
MKRFKQPFASIITKELIMYYYLFKKVDRIPLRNGSHYSYHKNSSYKIFLAAILLTAVIEGIGVFFLLHHLVPIISWIHTILVVYCLLYFISDYKAVLAKPITVTSQKLYLHLGIRSNEVILIENIQYAAKATKSMEEHKKDKSVFNMLLIDMEGHNVEIMLKEPIIKKTFFGKERPIYSIHIKVDSPSEFIQEVNSRQLQVCS